MRLRLFGAAAAISVCALALGGAAVAADISNCQCDSDPFAVAAAPIVCPAGPPGWLLGGNGWATGGGGIDGRFVLTPRTVIEGALLYGGTQAQVECNYESRSTAGNHLVVLVRYALTRSFNPYADFFIGCKTNKMGIGGPTGPQPWDSVARTYRVLSDVSWSYGTFIDYYNELSSGDVGRFEDVARTMLKSAEPVAHNCDLKLVPTAPQQVWFFAFNANVKNNGLTTTGGSSGSFATRPNDRGGTGELGALKARAIVLKISRGSKTVGAVAIKITGPKSFTYSYGAELKALVRVTSSSYLPCHQGATGTLTVSTNTGLATLQVCHRNLLAGTGDINAHISY
jgi:hypothetical protein